jgi:hypothetical protein
LGLDHCPLILNSGEPMRIKERRFFFEKQWFCQPGFIERVTDLWLRARSEPPHRYGPLCDSIDEWQNCIRRMRHYLRGWGKNVDCDLRHRNAALKAEISMLDHLADTVGISVTEWARRYDIERELTFIASCEEIYWQQRGNQKWIVEGDASTEFFHAVANGRKRRCTIHSL